MIFTHYGMVEDAVSHLKIAKKQLRLWVKGAVATGHLQGEPRVQVFYDWLIARDENYALSSQLPADQLQREREFLGNSLRGMVDYVAGLSEAERRKLAA